MIEKEFIPYEQALALKELGFDEPCLMAYIGKDNQLYSKCDDVLHLNTIDVLNPLKAPLFSQAFRWFREKYNVHSSPRKYDETKWWVEWGTWTSPVFETYEEAEFSWLEKLIEIVKTK